MTAPADWLVYIILGTDLSLYTGISNDLEKRLDLHRTGKGAKYFWGRDPLAVVYLETGHTRSSSSKREAQIKKLTRQEKLCLASSEKNELR